MSPSLISGFVWVVLSACVAMLPMRHQYVPGVALLIAAPILIGWIGIEHGFLYGLIGLLAFLSMFRNPLKYFAKKALGKTESRPKGPEE